MLYFYLALYISVIILTYIRLQNKTSKITWVGLLLSLIAVALTPIALLMAWEPNRPSEIFMFGFILPFFMIGLGLALGGWTKKLRLNKMPVFSSFNLGASILLPVVWLAYLHISAAVKDNAKSTALYNYQSLTVSDRLGTQDLRIPISPQLKLQYSCIHRAPTRGNVPYSYSDYKDCKAGKFDKDYREKDVSERSRITPPLIYIEVSNVAETCNLAYARTCIKPDVLKAWCARRTEYASHIWCTNTLNNRIRYKRYFSANTELENKRWSFERTLPQSQDINGEPVEIKCSRRVDEKIAAALSDNLEPRRRLCRLKYLIETEIEVTTSYNVTAPDTLLPEAQQAYDHAQNFWIEMKRSE